MSAPAASTVSSTELREQLKSDTAPRILVQHLRDGHRVVQAAAQPHNRTATYDAPTIVSKLDDAGVAGG